MSSAMRRAGSPVNRRKTAAEAAARARPRRLTKFLTTLWSLRPIHNRSTIQIVPQPPALSSLPIVRQNAISTFKYEARTVIVSRAFVMGDPGTPTTYSVEAASRRSASPDQRRPGAPAALDLLLGWTSDPISFGGCISVP